MLLSNIMNKLLKSKILLGVMICAVIFVGFAVVKTASASDCTITKTLKQGMTGADVICLQSKLGLASNYPTGYFGSVTLGLVKTFQSANALTADGVVGPLTRSALMTVQTTGYPAGCTSAVGYSTTTGLSCSVTTTLPTGCTSTVGYSPTTGLSCSGGSNVVTNGPGNISDFKKDSTYNSEEVTQGATDAKVVGFNVKADSGSDLAIQTLNLDLSMTAGTGSTNLNHYFNTVSIWEGTTKVATVNASDFTKSGIVYSKNIALSGASVKANQTNEFYITVSANSSIDSLDLGHNTWTATIQSLRFVDGTGAIMTDPTTGDLPYAQTFSFESLATAGAKALKVSLTTGQDAINASHVVTASTTATTNDIPLLAFDLKATGDIKHITDIPVDFSMGGTSNGVAKIANSFTLWKDGVKIDTIDASEGTADQYVTTFTEVAHCGTGDSCAIHFDNIDFDLNDGATAHMVVKANISKILGTGGNFTEGDTLLAQLSSTDTTGNVDHIVAEDVNTDNLATTDLSGGAVGNLVYFRSKGINVSLVSTVATLIPGDQVGHTADAVQATITFDVTAFGGDMWIDHTAPDASGGATESDLDVLGTGTLLATIQNVASSSTATPETDGTDAFVVREGTTQRFVITSHVLATAAGYFNVALTDLLYAQSDIDGDTQYVTGLSSFKTSNVYLSLN